MFNAIVPPLHLEYMLYNKDTRISVKEYCINVAQAFKDCGVKMSFHQTHEMSSAGELTPVCHIIAHNITKKKLEEKCSDLFKEPTQ